MVLPSLDLLIPFIQNYGYPIIFLLMFFEGPIITYVAAFASSLGFFNPLFIFILSVFGNFLPDLCYYLIGHVLKKKLIFKFFSFFGVSRKKVHTIRGHIRNHSVKTMILVKVVPGIVPVGLTVAAMALPFRRFFTLSVIISAIYSLVFFLLGYFSGEAYNLVLSYFKTGEIIIGIFLGVFIVGWILIGRWLRGRIKDSI